MDTTGSHHRLSALVAVLRSGPGGDRGHRQLLARYLTETGRGGGGESSQPSAGRRFKTDHATAAARAVLTVNRAAQKRERRSHLLQGRAVLRSTSYTPWWLPLPTRSNTNSGDSSQSPGEGLRRLSSTTPPPRAALRGSHFGDSPRSAVLLRANPALLATRGVGADTAALLVTAGDNPEP